MALGLLERAGETVDGAGDAIEAAGGIDALEGLVYAQVRPCDGPPLQWAAPAMGRPCDGPPLAPCSPALQAHRAGSTR